MSKNTKYAKQPEGPFCQSCGMPMGNIDCFGTKANKERSEDYCCHCFQNGAFVDSSITMEEMIDLSSSIMTEKMNMPEAKTIEICRSFIPTLKRWQKTIGT